MPKEYKHISRMFTKEFLLDVLSKDAEGAEIIEDEMYDKSRWSLHYWLIFKFEDKFYGVGYSRGATEYQDESPWEYDGDNIETFEQVQVTKTIITYESKKEPI